MVLWVTFVINGNIMLCRLNPLMEYGKNAFKCLWWLCGEGNVEKKHELEDILKNVGGQTVPINFKLYGQEIQLSQ